MINFMLLGVVFARTACDLSFKAAVQKLHFDSFDSIIPNLKKIFLSPFIYSGFLFGGINVLLWCFALTELDLSYAYPFLSISYLTIMIAAKFIFNEHIGRQKIIGLSLIALGTICLFIG